MQRILGAIGLSVLLKRAAIEQVDADVPEVVFLSARSERLNDLAWALAAEARDDPAAVRELRVAAGRRGERHLRAAAAAVRVLGLVNEDRTHNLANRLLLAAAVNAAVAPLTEEEGTLLDDLEALRRLPLEEAFDRLVHREPALEPLQDRLAALAETMKWWRLMPIPATIFSGTESSAGWSPSSALVRAPQIPLPDLARRSALRDCGWLTSLAPGFLTMTSRAIDAGALSQERSAKDSGSPNTPDPEREDPWRESGDQT